MADIQKKTLFLDIVKFTVEASLAALLVVGISWGFCRLAERQANRPIPAGGDGVVLLPAARAVLNGEVKLAPTDKENQKADFAYHFGRELHAERQSRTICDWSGRESSVVWKIFIGGNAADSQKTTYELKARLAASREAAGNRFIVTIGNDSGEVASIRSTVAGTGGWDAWKETTLGTVELAPGQYHLTITPDGGPIQGGRLLNLAAVELHPLDSASTTTGP